MDHLDGLNGSMDHPRHSFPGAFLGLQGIPGLLPGPSGMHGADSFGKFCQTNHFLFIFLFFFSFHLPKKKKTLFFIALFSLNTFYFDFNNFIFFY